MSMPRLKIFNTYEDGLKLHEELSAYFKPLFKNTISSIEYKHQVSMNNFVYIFYTRPKRVEKLIGTLVVWNNAISLDIKSRTKWHQYMSVLDNVNKKSVFEVLKSSIELFETKVIKKSKAEIEVPILKRKLGNLLDTNVQIDFTNELGGCDVYTNSYDFSYTKVNGKFEFLILPNSNKSYYKDKAGYSDFVTKSIKLMKHIDEVKQLIIEFNTKINS